MVLENMTVRHYVGNGFYWYGVHGYRGSYLTAYANGDYGLYAYLSVDGQFDHDYAAGQPNGFYIGACHPCNAVITEVLAEKNGLGYSGTNAGGTWSSRTRSGARTWLASPRTPRTPSLWLPRTA